MPFTVAQLDHVELLVTYIPASARWYAEVLGLVEAHRWDPEPVMIGAGGTLLALFQAAPGRALDPSPAPHWHRVAWRTDAAGFAAAQEHLGRLGIRFRGPVDHGLAWSVYFEDPDGHLLEITTYDRQPPAG